MSLHTIARRYAGAIFDVAKKNNRLDRVEAQLDAFTRLVAERAELRKVFEIPVIPPHKKRAVLEALLERMPEIDGEVREMLRMLADRDRLVLLPAIAAGLQDRLRQHRHVVPAEIVTAVPLPDAQRTTLAAALRRASGSDITISEKVDPAIVGGVVARVGSVVFDGSVTRQLERMKQRLLDGA